MKKIHFKNLNGLRFFAALAVLICHIEQAKQMRGFESLYQYPLIKSLGTLGVVLFFVLSGFLITYLLLAEKQEALQKRISIKNFYIRRILRIWPLYFLVLLLGLFVMHQLHIYEFNPQEQIDSKNLPVILLLFIFFMPNVILVIFGGLPFLHQTWSIGAEEQFYLIWPWIIQKSTSILKTLLIIYLVFFLVKLGLHFLRSSPVLEKVYDLWCTLSISSLCTGAVFSYFLFSNNNKALEFLFSTRVKLSVLIVTLACFAGISYIPAMIRYEIFSVLFGVIIINLAGNKNLKFSLENACLDYLGKISYGIYMLHPICIAIAFYFFAGSWLVYVSSVFMTLLFSIASYELYEKKFIRLKFKYAIINTQ